MPRKPTLFIIDGSNNVYRSYFAIRGLTNSAGLATNAVYGFTQTLKKLLNDHKPDSIAVAFDIGSSKTRHEAFADYKKDRRPMPDDLSVQLPFVNDVLEGFHIPVIGVEDWEADDLIGSLACKARDRGYDVVIATSDKDFFQLVGDGIRLFHTGREVMYDAKGAEEAFGLPPEKVVGPEGGRPSISHRVVVRVIWFVLASGYRWQDVPQEMGCSGRTAHRRLQAYESRRAKLPDHGSDWLSQNQLSRGVRSGQLLHLGRDRSQQWPPQAADRRADCLGAGNLGSRAVGDRG